MNGVAMNTFTIDANSNITAFASLDEARAAQIQNAVLAISAGAGWPAVNRKAEKTRSGQIWLRD
jgi:hypothetical protein